jgi:hypothetical protein
MIGFSKGGMETYLAAAGPSDVAVLLHRSAELAGLLRMAPEIPS